MLLKKDMYDVSGQHDWDGLDSIKAETKVDQRREFLKVMHLQRTAKQPESQLSAVLAGRPQNLHSLILVLGGAGFGNQGVVLENKDDCHLWWQ